MNFFGVGPAELIVILVVALVFVGPERLPRLAADLARTIREIRKYTGSLAAEFNEVIQDFEKETETDRSQWKAIGQGLTGATQSVTEAIRGARADAATGGAPAPATENAAPASGGASPGLSVAPDASAGERWRDIPEPGAPHTVNGQGPASHLDGPRPPPDGGQTATEVNGARPGTKGVASPNGAAQAARPAAPEEPR